MSNARSPRDVCSTTMGTRGLMRARFFSLSGAVPSGLRLSTGFSAPHRFIGRGAHVLDLGSGKLSPMQLPIDLGDVERAAARLKGVAHRTPLVTSRTLDREVGARVV